MKKKHFFLILLTVFLHCSCSNSQQKVKSDPIQKKFKTNHVNPESDNLLDLVAFRRQNEPRERAFSLMVPRGWVIEGGIFRVDPNMQGGAAQSIAAKCDFTVKNNNPGHMMIRWLPDVLFFDMRGAPAASMFPPGSNYNGMTVMPKMPCLDFIVQVVIPYAHPNAVNVKVVEEKQLPDMVNRYTSYTNHIAPYLTMAYQSSITTITYTEGGKNYIEKIVTVIEDWGVMGAGLWGNKETFLIRTPVGEYEKWAPVFSIIQGSVQFNSNWLIGEIKGQMKRSRIMEQTLKTIRDIDQQIITHQQQTNAEIHNDMFLTLTDQEEYVNPYNGKIETGSNQWQHRWVSETGDIIYTDLDDFNPNYDPELNNVSFKKTPIRKRKPH